MTTPWERAAQVLGGNQPTEPELMPWERAAQQVQPAPQPDPVIPPEVRNAPPFMPREIPAQVAEPVPAIQPDTASDQAVATLSDDPQALAFLRQYIDGGQASNYMEAYELVQNDPMASLRLDSLARADMGRTPVEFEAVEQDVASRVQPEGGREARDLFVQRYPDIDPDGAASFGQQVYAGFMQTPEAREIYLTGQFGERGQGWDYLQDENGVPTTRVVVRQPDGTLATFDSVGPTMSDTAAIPGATPELAGGIGGAMLASPTYALSPLIGVPLQAGAEALGAQLLDEGIGRLFPENREAESLGDVLSRSSGEAATDFMFGAGSGLGGQLARGIGNVVRAPFARSAARPEAVAAREAADRMARAGFDPQLLPSEAGAGTMVGRIEGLLSKLPGGSAAFDTLRAAREQALRGYTVDLRNGVTPTGAGEDAIREFDALFARQLATEARGLESVDMALADEMRAVAESFGARAQSPQGAGRVVQSGLEQRRDQFRAEARRLYDEVRALPGGSDPIVPTEGLRNVIESIRQQLPPNADGTPSTAFSSPELTRLIGGAGELDEFMTLGQATQLRNMLFDSMENNTALPGISTRFLSMMADSVGQAIEDAARTAGPELSEALGRANSFYRENADQFRQRGGIDELFRDETQGGALRPSRVLPRALSGEGNPEIIQGYRGVLGPESAEFRTFQASAWDQLVNHATVDGQLDARRLSRRMDGLSQDTIEALFPGQSGAIRQAINDLAARERFGRALDTGGDISMEALRAPDGDIGGMLERLRVIRNQNMQEFREGPLASFLSGEGTATTDARTFIPYLVSDAVSPEEVAAVMARARSISPELETELQQGVMAELLGQAARSTDPADTITRLMGTAGEVPSGVALASGMGQGGSAAADIMASQRVQNALTPEQQAAMRDLAVVAARTQQTDQTSSAIGGLAAGAAITGAALAPGAAAQSFVVLSGVARAITTPAVRAWLTNTRRMANSPGFQTATVLAGPAWARVEDELSNEDRNALLEYLGMRRPQSELEREWGTFFGGQPANGTAPVSQDAWRQYFTGGQQ